MTRRADEWLLSPWRWLLAPLWLLTRPVFAIHALLWNRGWRTPRRLGVPVISIGNITVGGTGKTPAVAWLLERLPGSSNPAVLMRGYKGDGDSNDESRMLGAPVFCDPHRTAAGERAITAGHRVLLLDDGFQHRRLARDCDIVLIDATRPWGGGHLLPLGLLREPPRALRRAHAVIITRCDQVTSTQVTAITERVGRWCETVCRARHLATGLQGMDGQQRHPVDHLQGPPLVLVSGIGNPASFATSVRALGGNVHREHRFPDHHHYTPAEIAAIADSCPPGALVITTAKDAVKLRPLHRTGQPLRDWWVLEMAFAMEPDDQRRLSEVIGTRTGVALEHREPQG